MTLPVWISPAAAFVTAAVTRLVAPVWSLGPHGEAGTILLQSLCANAAEPTDSMRRSTAEAINILRIMIESPFPGERPDSVIDASRIVRRAVPQWQESRLLRCVRRGA